MRYDTDISDLNGLFCALLLIALVDRVPGASHRAERIGLRAAVEGAAQTSHVHVDCTFVDIDVAAPDAVEKLFTGIHPARVLHQEFQQTEFGRAEADVAGAARNAFTFAVKLDVVE